MADVNGCKILVRCTLSLSLSLSLYISSLSLSSLSLSLSLSLLFLLSLCSPSTCIVKMCAQLFSERPLRVHAYISNRKCSREPVVAFARCPLRGIGTLGAPPHDCIHTHTHTHTYTHTHTHTHTCMENSDITHNDAQKYMDTLAHV
jgi:hypothetical protein